MIDDNYVPGRSATSSTSNDERANRRVTRSNRPDPNDAASVQLPLAAQQVINQEDQLELIENPNLENQSHDLANTAYQTENVQTDSNIQNIQSMQAETVQGVENTEAVNPQAIAVYRQLSKFYMNKVIYHKCGKKKIYKQN